jgi:hypothetical protein
VASCIFGHGPLLALGPSCVSEAHPERYRFSIGILSPFQLFHALIEHTTLMPQRGDGARFVQPCEPFARLFIGVQRLFVAALHHADGSKLALCNGDLSIVTDFLSAADTLFINSSRFIEPAQVAKAVASINQADGHPVLRAFSVDFA